MMRIADRVTRLVFETDDFVFDAGRQRQVVIEARPAYARVRLKGTRRSYAVPYSAVYQAAVRMEVDVARAVKRGARKARTR